MVSSERKTATAVPGLLAVLVLIELVVLRTGTRTLIHIPGLGRFQTPIDIVAEIGRSAYYLAVVSLVVTLVVLGYGALRDGTKRQTIAGAGVLAWVGVALAGRIGVISELAVGWSSLAILAVVTATVWRGMRTLPIGLFALGSVAAGWSVLGQGTGGGLSGWQVDGLVLVAEISLVLAGMTGFLLLDRPPRTPAILAGLGVGAFTLVAFTAGSSTVSILVLWNLGVPGWLPGIAYAIALGSLVSTLWSALASGQPLVAIGLVLLIGGGLGTISTYQTGLALAGMLVLGGSMYLASMPSPAIDHREVGDDGAGPDRRILPEVPGVLSESLRFDLH
ncbi:MAG: hypothetical protein WB239_15605 [Acidimicrobiia bacterium]